MKVWILNFHGIGKPHARVDESERPYWVSETRFARCVELCARHRATTAITFDDGNKSDIEVAAPALSAAGLTGSFFVLSDRVSHNHYLSAENMRELVDRGMEVGTHGAAHLNWRHLPDGELDRELVGARTAISDIIGRPVTSAAIPFGSYNGHVLRALRRRGYARVYTSDGGATRNRAWLQPRTSIRCDTDLTALEAAMTTGEPVARVVRRKVSMALRQALPF